MDDMRLILMETCRGLPCERLQCGTELLGRIPGLGPMAYLHRIYRPLSSNELASLEVQLNRPVPCAYRTFLSLTNGITLFQESLSLDGLRGDYSRKIDAAWQPYGLEIPNVLERLSDSSPELFFIGGYGDDGSLLYIDGEQVVRCSGSTVRPLNRWPTFEKMLVSETERIALLFKRHGIQPQLRPAFATIPSP